jgi:hypothetical protein
VLFKLSHMDTARAERLLSYTAIVYGINLAIPYTSGPLSVYGSEWLWGAIALAAGVIQRASIALNNRQMRTVSAGTSSLLWFAFSILNGSGLIQLSGWQTVGVIAGTPRVIFPFLWALFQIEIVGEHLFRKT